MGHTHWWHDRVIYQIYPRSFCDSNGDGVGDIPGIISKLDYLKELGIGAIWLSPVYRSPNADNGYDIADYRAINPEYGTLADMKRLLKESEHRDIKIVLDLVINHTSDEHEWFRQSIDSKSPYHDYYIWRPGRVIDGKEYPPNNWTSHFTGPAWTKHPDNGLYYLHLFTSKQPDLNYHNPRLFDEIKDMMRFWLDLGVAGFRCDVINMIYKTSLADGDKRSFAIGQEFYLSQPGSHALLKRLHDEVWEPYGAYTVGETVDLDEREAKAYVDGELETIFQFDHTKVDQWKLPLFKIRYRPAKMARTLLHWQRTLPWNTLFFENHDMPRAVSRFGNDKDQRQISAKMLAMALLTLRGVPFIYQGQEIGQINDKFTAIAQVNDAAAIGVHKILRGYHVPEWLTMKLIDNFCRDHARAPMPWNDAPHGGFTIGKPWLAVNPSYRTINVASALADTNSIWHFYRKMLEIRSRSEALRHGTITPFKVARDVLAFHRTHGNEKLTVLINLGPRQQRLNPNVGGTVIIANFALEGKATIGKLGPYQAVLMR